MTTTINWRKWADEKPDFDRDILMLREENDISIGQYFLCTDKSEWIQFDEGSCHAANDIIPIQYWCYTSELYPKKKYNSVKEFFEEPIPKHIEDEVNCQVRIAASCVAFGEWLADSYTIRGQLTEPRWSNYSGTILYSTSELWVIYKEYE